MARKYMAEAAIRQEARRKKREQLAPLVNRAQVNYTYDDYWRGQKNLGLADSRDFFPELSKHTSILPWLERGLDSALPHNALQSSANRSKLRVLHVGAGMSTLTDEMLARGFVELTNTDVSAAAVHMLRLRAGTSGGRYEVADATNLRNYHDGSFDAIVEKGAMDYLISETDGSLSRALAEFKRVLSPGGVLCSISGAGVVEHGDGAARLMPFIKASFPDVEIVTLQPLKGDPRPAHLFLGRSPITV